MLQSTIYGVYEKGRLVSAGSLNACWQWLLNRHDIAVNPIYATAFDLAEAGVYIAPVSNTNV